MCSNALVEELVRLADRIATCKNWRRTRLAVTAQEHEQVRQYMLARYGQFHGRIRDIPLTISIRGIELVTEDNPTAPPLWVEFAE